MVNVTNGGGGAGTGAAAGGAAPAAPAVAAQMEAGYEVRWDEGQRLFRVWNPLASAWVSAPGFSDERIARVVAEGLSSPPQARRGGTEAKKRG